MEETLIRGLVIGVMFAAIGIAASLIWKLMRSPSEGARRVRWVIAAAVALSVAAALYASGGIADVILGAAVIGVAVWIYRGFKKG